MTARRLSRKPEANEWDPYEELGGGYTPTDEEIRIGLFIYGRLELIKTIDGEGVSFSEEAFRRVINAMRYVVPRAIREDPSLTPEQRRAYRKHLISGKRGLDLIGDPDSPVGVRKLKVFFAMMAALGSCSEEFLKYIEFQYDPERAHLERPEFHPRVGDGARAPLPGPSGG